VHVSPNLSSLAPPGSTTGHMKDLDISGGATLGNQFAVDMPNPEGEATLLSILWPIVDLTCQLTKSRVGIST